MVDKKIIEQEKGKVKEDGWKTLSSPLKFLFVLLVFNVLFSLFSLGNASYFFLGIIIYGLVAIFITLLLNVAGSLVLLLAIWKRFEWTWKYGAAYFGFFILNGLIALGGVLLNLFGSTIQSIAMIKLVFIILLSLILNILFFVIIMKNKKYLERGAAK